jgi:hypothetical protein
MYEYKNGYKYLSNTPSNALRRSRITKLELDKMVEELDVRGTPYWNRDMIAKKYRLSKSLAMHIWFTMVTTEPKKI